MATNVGKTKFKSIVFVAVIQRSSLCAVSLPDVVTKDLTAADMFAYFRHKAPFIITRVLL